MLISLVWELSDALMHCAKTDGPVPITCKRVNRMEDTVQKVQFASLVEEIIAIKVSTGCFSTLESMQMSAVIFKGTLE